MGIILSSISNVLYCGEKFAACITITAIIWCLVGTLIITLGLGIGLGYNYCFVDIKTKYKYIAPRVRYPPPADVARSRGNRKYTPYPYPYPISIRYPYQSPRNGSYPYPYPGSLPLRILEEEEEATLPNLSGDDPDNITSTISNASDNFNKTTSPSLNETATSINDMMINITSDTNSTLAVNTTKVFSTSEVSNTTAKNTTIEESTEKLDIEEEFPKMSIPISGLDLIGLLSRLRAENRNYTLQIVT